MAKYAKTVSVTTSAGTFTTPTVTDRIVRVHNLDSANGVWLAVDGPTTAAAEADECVFIPAGASYYVPWQPDLSMIAITATCKVVLDNGQNRG